MLWEVLWPLAFGFLLSAMIQTVVSKRAVANTLGRPDLKGFVLACGFGAARSPRRQGGVNTGWPLPFPPLVGAVVHRDLACVLHGLERPLPRPGAGLPHRRRPRGLGAQQLVAGVLPHQSPCSQ